MLNFKTAAISLAFAALSASAYAAPSGTTADFGSPVPAAAATRTIAINADTRWINVTNGETVELNLDGQSFTWHFDTYVNETSFDLAKIAPGAAQAGKVRVYVAANPLYSG